MHKYIIGVDNGTSGTISILSNNPGFKPIFIKTPTISQQNYTKKKGNITRIDVNAIRTLFEPYQGAETIVLLERPLVNPGRFKATISGVRALEATLIIVEEFGMAYQYEDSKKWQKELLPSGMKGPELKKASMDVGLRLYPQFNELITKHKDADGLLIAEYGRRNNL